jgi:hypothetical protein
MQLSSMRPSVASSSSTMQPTTRQPHFNGLTPKSLLVGATAVFTAAQLAGCGNTKPTPTTVGSANLPSLDQPAQSHSARLDTCAKVKNHIETVIGPKIEQATDGKNYGLYTAVIADCQNPNGTLSRWNFKIDNVKGFQQSTCPTMGQDTLKVFKTDIIQMLEAAKALSPNVELYCSNTTPPPMPRENGGTTSVFNPNPFKAHRAPSV